MKINKMSTEDLRAAIAKQKSNRYSKYFKDLCAELAVRQNRKVFVNMRQIREQEDLRYLDGRTIWSSNKLMKENSYFHSLVRRLPNPELI